jgi:DNA-binding MarR family transcriptional regulator
MADLAAELTISRGGLTKLADRLEQAGLLRRESAEGDGRGLYAVLTDEGDATLGRIWPVYAGVLREAFVGAVSAAEADAIAAGLARAAEAARTPAA